VWNENQHGECQLQRKSPINENQHEDYQRIENINYQMENVNHQMKRILPGERRMSITNGKRQSSRKWKSSSE
jgi:phage-related protein